jgi:HPt (histidine-containing phosphotransfer) domain-containing protein
MARRRPSPTAAELQLLDPDGTFRQRLADDRKRLALPDPTEHKITIHRLAGAAATFGYAEVGDIAVALDDLIADGHPIPPDTLTALLAALDSVLEKSA